MKRFSLGDVIRLWLLTFAVGSGVMVCFGYQLESTERALEQSERDYKVLKADHDVLYQAKDNVIHQCENMVQDEYTVGYIDGVVDKIRKLGRNE